MCSACFVAKQNIQIKDTRNYNLSLVEDQIHDNVVILNIAGTGRQEFPTTHKHDTNQLLQVQLYTYVIILVLWLHFLQTLRSLAIILKSASCPTLSKEGLDRETLRARGFDRLLTEWSEVHLQ